MRSILRTAFFFLFVATTAMAADEVINLDGTWELSSRFCYSGAPVRDPFLFGRDTMELTFRGQDFRSFSDVNNCVNYAKGKFAIRGRQLVIDVMKQVNSCNGDRRTGRVMYPFEIQDDFLTIHLGVVGYGGPCPQGDSFAVVYQRLN